LSRQILWRWHTTKELMTFLFCFSCRYVNCLLPYLPRRAGNQNNPHGPKTSAKNFMTKVRRLMVVF
jgi:hypothetical protein